MSDNIRKAAVREYLAARGFSWVTIVPRGENTGQVVSRHRSYEAANAAARGLDLTIVEVANGDTV